MINHGVAWLTYSAPSNNQLSGCIKGSSTTCSPPFYRQKALFNALCHVEAEATDNRHAISTPTLSGSDSQFVRHHHKSNNEHIERKSADRELGKPGKCEDAPITVKVLLSACLEAAEFSLRRVETVHDVVAHARTFAPMIGISSKSYEAAHQRLGPLRTAATVWAIVQFHDKIRAVGAYFHSITTGSKSAGFSPEKLIRRLAMARIHAA